VFAGVPTMYYYLTQRAGDVPLVHNLRVCITGGASMPTWILHEFEQRFGVTVLEGYGLSETSPVASFNVRGQPRKVGSIGVPIPDVQMRVVDENGLELEPGEIGEIVIRGPNVMKGYYRRPEETAQVIRHGWFHTGDLAYIDKDGYFFIVGRKTDMIIKGGFNVYPREVEIVLESHPSVLDVAVVGVPNEALGEEVKAFVVLHEDQQVTGDELISHCQDCIAAYKCPGIVEFRESLPKGDAGDTLKRELKS
jgi:long-chain acyl-CoA synthetase